MKCEVIVVKGYFLISVIIMFMLVTACSNNVDLQTSQDVPLETSNQDDESDVQTVDEPDTTGDELVSNILKVESQTFADQYVSDLEMVTGFGGKNFRLLVASPGDCSSCWDFLYEYDYSSADNPEIVVKKLAIQVSDFKITNIVFH